RSAVIRDCKLHAADNRIPISRGQLHRKNVSERTILVPAAREGIAAAHHEETAAAVAHEVNDVLELILREERGLDTAEDQAFVGKQFVLLLRETFRQHLFFVDALVIEL